MLEYGAVVHFRFRPIPFGIDLIQGLFGRVRIFVEDGDQIAVPDNFGAVHFFSIFQVDAFQPGVMRRRPQDFGVQHAGQPDVAGIARFPGHLLPGIQAAGCGAGNGVLGNRQGRHPLLQAAFDDFAAGKLRVGHPAARIL